MGFRFGEGIYFSYFFTLLWLADVAWMWFSPAGYQRRSLAITGFGLGYLAFIAFNGAVVFETHLTRWVGIPVSIALAILAWQAWFAPLATASEPGAERA